MEVVRLDMVECGEAYSWVIASLAMAMFGNVCVSKVVAHTNTANVNACGRANAVCRTTFFTDFQFMGTGKV